MAGRWDKKIFFHIYYVGLEKTLESFYFFQNGDQWKSEFYRKVTNFFQNELASIDSAAVRYVCEVVVHDQENSYRFFFVLV